MVVLDRSYESELAFERTLGLLKSGDGLLLVTIIERAEIDLLLGFQSDLPAYTSLREEKVEELGRQIQLKYQLICTERGVRGLRSLTERGLTRIQRSLTATSLRQATPARMCVTLSLSRKWTSAWFLTALLDRKDYFRGRSNMMRVSGDPTKPPIESSITAA